MIIRLNAGRFGGQGGVHSFTQFLYKFVKTTGTWIAVSPDEIIPEKYKKYIQDDEILRVVNNIPSDWTMLKLGNRTNNFRSFVKSVEDAILSVPRTKYIREVSDEFSTAILCIASKDLGYPKTYYAPKSIYYKFEWAKNDDNWTLFYLGWGNGSRREKIIENFKSTLSSDITFITDDN